ncbi:amidohydrolase [Altererythrobacter arenosus]|uniref:Amidohydrolase n=1 Tax=Altererythrobacter arenosus TaxID=3032592 RepID=A0ABY8FSW8_9SPHN|nr:amidohydrolase [Altererythrobacter sp. CAU 1644]WFL77927.1 amidohydrolase [Altererythrobacter sp. CAU 1644]
MMYRSMLGAIGSLLLAGCASTSLENAKAPTADLILVNARVYTLDWAEPGRDGTPAPNAPRNEAGWYPDAEAVAIDDGAIAFVGTSREALALRSDETRVVDLAGATVLPGLVDSHSHVVELGAKLDAVDLTDVATEAEAVALVSERAKSVPKGQWILGAGWDEGAWANNYPDKQLLSAAVPDHPVALRSLHGFAVWTNQAALDVGAITALSEVPTGGEMRLGADGQPNGLFLNRATTLIDEIMPAPSEATMRRHAAIGLQRMAEDGYVTVHEAGADARAMRAFEQLEASGDLPIRVYAMLSLRDEDLMQRWIARGPDADADSMLVTRSVKAYYDGALGSRGARLLDDYSDTPGHRGVSGDGYGFDRDLNAAAMRAGFQVGIHAIGDAGNREALDILQTVFEQDPATRANRHRIEHAQVVSPADMPRFAQLGVIASMEPPHAVEDKTWAEDRLGPDRIRGAYAWRTLRENGAQLTFNADNPGSDHSIFYGLHAAVTRRDKNLQPQGGWYPDENLTIEEAIRAYTSWSAYAAFRERETGIIAQGRWADLTVMDIDPFVLAASDPGAILQGRIVMTVVAGKVAFER